MNDNLGKIINLNDLYDLIDLYKYASIEGEKVELIVYPTEDNKRIITIGLQNGFSRDRDTFIFEDGDKFDKEVMPQIISYYSCDDSLGNWSVVEPEIEGATIKATNETTSGNLVYLDTNDSELVSTLSDKVEEVKEDTTYKKEDLTNEDKIWDEIILYAKERRQLIDYYKGASFSKEELEKIYDFVKNLAENVSEINYGKSRKSRKNNEEYLNKLFKDKDKLLSMGFDEELMNKIVNTSTIKKLAHLSGIEKRVRKRLDLNNESIQSKIEFATSELDKVEYFDLKNASAKQFKNKEFIESRPKAIGELSKLYDNPDLYDEETREKYKGYCDEILEYLERKTKDEKKVVETKAIPEEITFTEYDNSVVDSYDDLLEALDLIQGAKLDSEHYEIIVEPDLENSTSRKVRIALIDGPTRSDVFEFRFNNGEEFDYKIKEILDAIYAKDPKFKTTILYVNKPFEELGKKELTETRDNNEVLLKGVKETLVLTKEKEIEKEKIVEDAPEHDSIEMVNGIPLEALEKLEKEILDYTDEKEKEPKESVKEDKNEFSLFDIDLATYKLLVDKYKDQLEDKFYNGELEFDEYKVVHKIYKLKNHLLDYYNENYEKSSTLSYSEMSKFAECELYLTAIYTIEAKYKDNKKRIQELSKDTNLISAGKLLLSTLRNLDEFSENNEKNMDSLVDFSINRYAEIMEKYNSNPIGFNSESMRKEKDELLQMITYKIKLSDAYNTLVFRQDELTDEELKLLANYETKLIKIYEIDSKHQENIDAIINELSKDKQFLTPSARLWLSELAEESNKDILFEVVENKKEDKEKDFITEIKDAYEKAMSYSNIDTPASIQVKFERGNKEEADLIIYNKVEDQNIVEYQRTFDSETLEKDIMPVLGDIYSNNNELKFNIKFNVADSNDACLLLSGVDHRELKITYAPEEFVDKYKKMFEEKFEETKEQEKTL